MPELAKIGRDYKKRTPVETTQAFGVRFCSPFHKLFKRRQAIEPIIGHLKADHRMDRCYLKGKKGDRLNAVLCAAGYNTGWLLRMIAKKGVAFSAMALSLRLCAANTGPLYWRQVLHELKAIAANRPYDRLMFAGNE